MKASGARLAATRVLFRVAEEGAYASPALDAEIARAGLDRRDAALATELVYGTLRALPAVDRVLDARLARPSKTDAWLRAALRAGAYQLLHLSRVPPHAAVSQTVSVVRRERGPRLAGVANAVLRKVARERPADPRPPERTLLPAWIERAVRDGLGEARADAFLGARRLPPPLGLRAVGTPAGALADALRDARPRATVEVSRLVEGAVTVRGAGDPRALPGFEEGRFAVQELGSQRIVALAEVAPGERVADLCAGHGTKTLAFAERVGPDGRVEAVDLYEEKLERLEEERARLRLPAARIGTRAVDLTVGTGGLEAASFDRVILDAPCTGLGTVHRRPELSLRLCPDDPARLAALQARLLETARSLVRPGGTLVYAICSPTRAEVAPALAGPPPLEEGADEDGVVRLGPWLGEELDAYQVVRWRRPR
ncbi:MAG TPA: transcription antitermination factor NusB [Sandaracinaceae bacterium LLY-WYZ-13_1]|nr:transcription antitermination factor NusB [Sandaracinaceae bacterium LLY-WYZ-13_1]